MASSFYASNIDLHPQNSRGLRTVPVDSAAGTGSTAICYTYTLVSGSHPYLVECITTLSPERHIRHDNGCLVQFPDSERLFFDSETLLAERAAIRSLCEYGLCTSREAHA